MSGEQKAVSPFQKRRAYFFAEERIIVWAFYAQNRQDSKILCGFVTSRQAYHFSRSRKPQNAYYHFCQAGQKSLTSLRKRGYAGAQESVA
ncbi:hypothetical protein DIM_17750 [Candidatus Denitrolinea symbiosum]|nr:hypothetical protein DIM_17750 [Candidatus Denitrolinea symbiosum]